MRERARSNTSILSVAGAAVVAAVVSITMMMAFGWQRPAGASHGKATVAAHSLPHWMMAAGLLGSPAITPNAWMSPGSAYTGVADYVNAGAYTFTVPEGTTTVLVQLYGAGGGGGGGTSTLHGGGAGSGAYVMSVVSVTPGATYTINEGAGGAPGALNEPGGNGGDTSFVDPSGNVLVAAGGGQGGRISAPGAGGQPIGSPMIGRSGQTAVAEHGGPGYTLSVLGIGNMISDGGAGKQGMNGKAQSGLTGYAFIAW